MTDSSLGWLTVFAVPCTKFVQPSLDQEIYSVDPFFMLWCAYDHFPNFGIRLCHLVQEAKTTPKELCAKSQA